MGLLTEDYFAEVNIAGKIISKNEHLKDYRNYIVYGYTFGDFKDNRYRYLGWTMMNDKFTNYLFPNDVTSAIGLWNRNWIEKPKRNPLTREREEVINDDGKFDNNPLYEESIRLGLKLISRKDSKDVLLDFPETKL